MQITYYVDDVVYSQNVTNGTTLQQVVPAEYQIFGTDRIGVYFPQESIYAYEMTDHLGNVRAVITQNAGTMEVRSYSDYYPYGRVIAKGGTNDYRYGYQGQYAEADPETILNAFELRMYDSRIGRWLQFDPDRQFHSPYLGMANDPANTLDPDGGSTDDWFAHLNADGSVSLYNDAGVHSDYEFYGGQYFVNVGEDDVSANQAEANANGYFSNFQSYFGNFHDPVWDAGYFFEEETYANRPLFESTVTSGTGATTWSSRNDRLISQLDPRMQQPVIDLINRSEKELGTRIFILESYRSIETQAAYYAQGRTTPGAIITHAKPGYSFHQFRLAIDVYPTTPKGNPDFNRIPSAGVVNIAKQLGLEWGGKWAGKKQDNPHFQMTFGMTIAQVRALHGL